MDEIVLNEAEFAALLDYSCSLPTGVVSGKQWKRREPYHTGPGIKNRWYLGEYGEEDNEGRCPILWRRIALRRRRKLGRWEALWVRIGFMLPQTHEVVRGAWYERG